MVLVVSGPRGGEVAACCSKAVAQGVRPGMPVAEAQSLVHDLTVAKYDAEADRQALLKCAEACERFSPRVAIEEGPEPESLLLDISHLEHLWGSESRLVEEAERFFTRRGYVVRLGVAETVGAAWAAAHFSQEQVASFPTLKEDCKLQSENFKMQISDPLHTNLQFAICNLHFSISSLPVQSLRITDETAATLRELGIETIGQLAALPREALTARFGGELLRRLDQLTGVGREVIEPRRARAAFDVSCALEEPTSDRSVLLHVLKQLVEQLARQLAARGQGAVMLECVLYLAGGTPGVGDGRGVIDDCINSDRPFSRDAERSADHAFTSTVKLNSTATTPFAKSQGVPPQLLRVGLLQPSACARQLLELVELHLETVKLVGEVDRVELRAAVVGRLGERQGDLFADRWPTNSHQLAVLVNRLTSRLGHDRVLRAKLRMSAVPERAVRWGEVARREARVARKKDKETRRQGDKENLITSDATEAPCLPLSPSPCLPPRPLLLYPQPQAMEVVCVAPDGPPQAVWLRGRRESIVACAGPERIESLWWRGPSVRRDYYRIATESGTHLWLFRQLSDRRWYMHGVFT